MRWDEVIGQAGVKARLQGLVTSGHVPHALMLCGETGYGTLALALAMASTLLCQRQHKEAAGGMFDAPSMFGDDEAAQPVEVPAEPCGECGQCAMLRQWHHPDLLFTFPVIKAGWMSGDHKPVSDDYSKEWTQMLLDEGAYINIDNLLECLKAENQQPQIPVSESDSLVRKLALKSSQGGYKVAVVWLPERMNQECANKLLKTLEEPPQQTVFLFVCEQPELLLDTIRSRVQRIDVPKIDMESFTEALMERRGLDRETAVRMARVSDGNWITAMQQLQPDSESRLFLDLFSNLMRAVYQKDVKQMKKWSDSVSGKTFGRERQKRLLQYCQRMVRESFMSNFRIPELNYMTLEEEQFVSKFGRFINEANVIDINELFEEAIRDIVQNVTARMVFYDVALRLTVLLLRK